MTFVLLLCTGSHNSKKLCSTIRGAAHTFLCSQDEHIAEAALCCVRTLFVVLHTKELFEHVSTLVSTYEGAGEGAQLRM